MVLQNRRLRSGLASLVAALTLILLLAACQTPAPAGTPTGAPAAVPTAAGSKPTAEADPEPSDEATQAPTFAPSAGAKLVIYSGRSETLVAPLIEQFRKETGLDAEVRYGGTSELAATIMEEGKNSPADVFFAQDAGAPGALAAAGRLVRLPDAVLNQVDRRYRDDNGHWVGTSGRARVVVYNTNQLKESDLPNSIWGFTDPKWKGKLGWAPTNGSFQAFVTALRLLEGEDKARQWLEAMIANEIKTYPNNDAITEAVSAGEIEAGFVNHYYVLEIGSAHPNDFHAAIHHLTAGDAGSLVNVASAGIVNTAAHQEAALKFIEFLLSPEAQTYFATKTWEYPLAAGVAPDPTLRPIGELKAPTVDLSDLKDLSGTLTLLQDVGALD